MHVPPYVGFGLAVLPICLTPGVSFTLVTQRVLARGRRSGVLVAVGTSAGLVCHATLAAVGLAALVMRSSEAFTVVKIVGAAYLIGIGALTLWRARRPQPPAAAESAAVRAMPWSGRGDALQGFLGNVLNPKAAAVYLTLAPQFLHRGAPVLPQMAALVAAHIVVAVGWLLVWTVVLDAARARLATRRVRRVIDQVTGTVLVALGLRTATAAR